MEIQQQKIFSLDGTQPLPDENLPRRRKNNPSLEERRHYVLVYLELLGRPGPRTRCPRSRWQRAAARECEAKVTEINVHLNLRA